MLPDSLRRQVIAEWRGIDEPRDRPERCQSVSGVLSKLLPKLGLSERLSEQQITEAWIEIVGEFLARHSQPAGLAAGVLSVQVLQPSVRFELERNWKGKILARLQEKFGRRTIKEIRFRL